MTMREPSPNVRLSIDRSPSWESAFETYYVELCEYVLRLVGSADAAEDVVQDLFLNLWDTRGPCDDMRLTRPYLYVAARHRALKDLRHREVVRAWIKRASREEPPSADSPEQLYVERELRAAVDQAIAALPERCREIFLLRRRDQLSYLEIAARAGVSVGTVKSQMWRATVALKEKLAFILPAGLGVLGEEPRCATHSKNPTSSATSRATVAPLRRPRSRPGSPPMRDASRSSTSFRPSGA